jgi:hypothetical protein
MSLNAVKIPTLEQLREVAAEIRPPSAHHGASTAARPRRGPATAKEQYEVVLAAIEARRAEVLRLHRSGMIRNEVLRTLESDLDLQELAA